MLAISFVSYIPLSEVWSIVIWYVIGLYVTMFVAGSMLSTSNFLFACSPVFKLNSSAGVSTNSAPFKAINLLAIVWTAALTDDASAFE